MSTVISRDIRQIKLINGEELLTEVIGEDSLELFIRMPLKVVKEKVTMGEMNREANMFTNWMSFSDSEDFIISRVNVLVESAVNVSVARHYLEMTENIDQDHVTRVNSNKDVPNPEKLREIARAIASQLLDDEEPTYH
ncbi:hypothetical protein [Lake Baikal phage Baikal-20-5m-C28]|nr:hypothetical protein [Lake Baikal phage Baikal-20-5m-C28]